MEQQAPPLMRHRAATLSAAPVLLVPILALALALGVSGAASAAEPQPDAAPQAPAVVPDPAPEATEAAPPQQPAPVTPAQPAPQAPSTSEQPAAAAAPAPAPQTTQQTAPKPKPKAKPQPNSARASERDDTPASRSDRRAGPAEPSQLLRVKAFLPGVQGNEDSPSHLVLLAAAALLALVMASGSLLSVATRVWRSPLR